jgi:type IV pilus assembly protein PilV
MALAVKSSRAQQGFSLIEVLVTMIILMVGLLGLVGLMLQSQRSQVESYQRVQALVLMHDMVNRISTNRKAAKCYATVTPLGTGYTGTSTNCTETNPTAGQKSQAASDLASWSALLQGSAEKSGARDIGAMLGARGCITVTDAVPLAPLVAPNKLYNVVVSVVWQGNGKTVAPTGVDCGATLYGDDAQRRAVTTPIRIMTHIAS